MSAKHIPKDSPHSVTAKVHVRERNVYRIMKQEKNTPVDHIANDNQHSNSDIDSDGAINALDASYILSYYAFRATGGSGDILDFI